MKRTGKGSVEEGRQEEEKKSSRSGSGRRKSARAIFGFWHLWFTRKSQALDKVCCVLCLLGLLGQRELLQAFPHLIFPLLSAYPGTVPPTSGLAKCITMACFWLSDRPTYRPSPQPRISPGLTPRNPVIRTLTQGYNLVKTISSTHIDLSGIFSEYVCEGPLFFFAFGLTLFLTRQIPAPPSVAKYVDSVLLSKFSELPQQSPKSV